MTTNPSDDPDGEAVQEAQEILRENSKGALSEGAKRRRRKTEDEQKAQGSLDDIRLEDGELEGWLETYYEEHPKALLHSANSREAKKNITTRIEGRYPHALNSDDDGEHTGYVICGKFRFKPRADAHGEEEVEFTRHAGKTWEDLEIEVIGQLGI